MLDAFVAAGRNVPITFPDDGPPHFIFVRLCSASRLWTPTCRRLLLPCAQQGVAPLRVGATRVCWRTSQRNRAKMVPAVGVGDCAAPPLCVASDRKGSERRFHIEGCRQRPTHYPWLQQALASRQYVTDKAGLWDEPQAAYSLQLSVASVDRL